jgi:hypothetical protein
MYLCVRDIYFVSFYDFSVGFLKFSDSVFVLFFILLCLFACLFDGV